MDTDKFSFNGCTIENGVYNYQPSFSGVVFRKMIFAPFLLLGAFIAFEDFFYRNSSDFFALLLFIILALLGLFFILRSKQISVDVNGVHYIVKYHILSFDLFATSKTIPINRFNGLKLKRICFDAIKNGADEYCIFIVGDSISLDLRCSLAITDKNQRYNLNKMMNLLSQSTNLPIKSNEI